jgi:hypothetical protein
MKWLVVALALVAASAFAISVQAGVWWSVGQVSFGPFGTDRCFGGSCARTDLGWMGGSDLWMRSAVAVGAAGAIASFLLVLLAGATAAGRLPRVVARSTLVAIATSFACATYFMTQRPAVEGASLDRGALLFAGGIVIGTAACVVSIWRSRATAR